MECLRPLQLRTTLTGFPPRQSLASAPLLLLMATLQFLASALNIGRNESQTDMVCGKIPLSNTFNQYRHLPPLKHPYVLNPYKMAQEA